MNDVIQLKCNFNTAWIGLRLALSYGQQQGNGHIIIGNCWVQSGSVPLAYRATSVPTTYRPHCRLHIHIPHCPQPNPDLNPTPNRKPNANPKSYPNLKLLNE